MGDWTSADSAELYGVGRWGGGYFSVSETGELAVSPNGPGGAALSLAALVEELRDRGVRTPVLIRFSDILASRVSELSNCFSIAIGEYDYDGSYRGVYPIKVNQQRQVVEELVQVGRNAGLGLEVGSKPELLVALALLDPSDSLIVCNGYKDCAYLELALLAQRLGHTPFIVLDRPNELEPLIRVSKELGIRPHIGVRARLSARGAGKWAESTGDRSKFGLSASEIVAVVEQLRRADMLDSLEMLHFHVGSQITAIRAHKDALREASRIYVGLREMGAPLRLLNAGGGLGVDYDGSKSNFHSSMNYTTQEYAYDVVSAIQEACEEVGVPHPDIVTESGRALVSHMSVLVFDVLSTDHARLAEPTKPAEGEHKIVHDLWEVWANVGVDDLLESYHDALQLKEEAESAFALGVLNLEGRAHAGELFWSVAEKIWKAASALERVPEDLAPLERQLADTYYGNFSCFQSLPDTWAMGQLFPVMPIHRLNEAPDRRGIFGDLTCDSDGKLDQFIDLEDVRNTLPLHALDGAPYYIGAFLVGAYQETLGEAHNLLGDTHAVHVKLAEDGGYSLEQVVEGESVAEVLSYVQYDSRALQERVRRAVENALRLGEITRRESRLLRTRYEQGLDEYTYLQHDEADADPVA